jgi:murein DD-endopeptidase MepM/ murein hydrolase activator NlpD
MNNITDIEIKKKLKRLERDLPKVKSISRRSPTDINGKIPKRKLVTNLIKLSLGILLLFIIFPPFFWPVNAPVSSGFLFRFKPDSNLPNLEIHHGLDLAAARGTPIKVSSIGFVSETGRSPELGNYVRVAHVLGFSTLYAHMDRVETKKGSFVIPGLNTIGVVGSTGRATGPHVHFAIYCLQLALPPEPLLVFHSIRNKLVGF